VKEFCPIENESVDLSKRYRDELVIFQDAQALPLFLIYYDQTQNIKEFIIDEDKKNVENSGLLSASKNLCFCKQLKPRNFFFF